MEDHRFNIYGNGYLVACRCQGPVVSIPEGVRVIASRLFQGVPDPEELQLPETLVEICPEAFLNCRVLRSISLPESLTELGESAFRGCKNLEEIRIPSAIREIPARAFEGCTSLRKVVFQPGLKAIRDEAFRGCHCLEDISIPDGVTTLGSQVFSSESHVRRLRLPESVRELGERFFPSASLEELYAPGLLRLDPNALGGMSRLSVLVLPRISPQDLPSFHRDAALLGYALWLSQGGIPDKDVHPDYVRSVRSLRNRLYPIALENDFLLAFMLRNRVVPKEDMDRLLELAASQQKVQNTAMLLRYQVERFGNPDPVRESRRLLRQLETGSMTMAEFRRFWRSSRLPDGSLLITRYLGSSSEVEVPDLVAGHPVTVLGERLFENHQNLTSVHLPEGLLEIRDEAFHGCTGLKYVSLPSSLKSLGHGAFWGCLSLEAVDLPAGLEELGSTAFADCTSLRSLVLPAGLKRIPVYLFHHCSSLTRVTFLSRTPDPGDPPQVWEAAVFPDCPSLKDLSIPAQALPSNATFAGCAGLSRWEVHPDNPWLKADGVMLLSRDGAVLRAWMPGTRGEIRVPEGIRFIGERSFEDTKITAITLPSTLEAIQDQAFQGSLLQSVRFEAAPRTIGAAAFRNCSWLQQIAVPEGVRELGDEAFAGCQALRSVTLPEQMDHIGEKCFHGCRQLSHLVLPAVCPHVGASALFHCSSLTEVRFPLGEALLREEMFSGCILLQELWIPGERVTLDSTCLRWCPALCAIHLPWDLGDTDLEKLARFGGWKKQAVSWLAPKGSPAEQALKALDIQARREKKPSGR